MALGESVDYAQVMKTSWLLIALFWAASSSAAVYKWVDEEGVVHYGDSPPITGAEAVDLPEVSRFQSRQLPGTSTAPQRTAPSGAFQGYDSLIISRPENDATIRSNEGLVTVNLALSPGLQEGHRVHLLLDGRLVTDDAGTGVQLSGVDRGTHELTAVVVDEEETEWLRSSPVRFYLHKVSLLNKPAVIGPQPPPEDDTGNGDDTGEGDGDGEGDGEGDGDDTNGGDGAADSTPAAPASPYAPSYAPSYTP